MARKRKSKNKKDQTEAISPLEVVHSKLPDPSLEEEDDDYYEDGPEDDGMELSDIEKRMIPLFESFMETNILLKFQRLDLEDAYTLIVSFAESMEQTQFQTIESWNLVSIEDCVMNHYPQTVYLPEYAAAAFPGFMAAFCRHISKYNINPNFNDIADWFEKNALRMKSVFDKYPDTALPQEDLHATLEALMKELDQQLSPEDFEAMVTDSEIDSLNWDNSEKKNKQKAKIIQVPPKQ